MSSRMLAASSCSDDGYVGRGHIYTRAQISESGHNVRVKRVGRTVIRYAYFSAYQSSE
ncbi:hypothetical protein Mapa_004595 [Marchantia paleacea]|nr:hypothetical protein Mapa_004595 [Marchantia paleacea]